MPILAPNDGTSVYEQGDRVYMIAPLAPATPTPAEIQAFAYGQSIVEKEFAQTIIDRARGVAPNEHIAWFGGHYVEGDRANANGTMWRGSEIAIRSVTPMFMPVTVMHDMGTAVGLIADVALKTPDKHQVPRSKIETALALWKHRFPEIVEEAEYNYREGTLMQSMECLYSSYECSACGAGYHPLPEQAERANWCACLRGEGEQAGARILGNTVFTGTGLIFGTRGATGADGSAYLDSFQQEVAEFHQTVNRDKAQTTRSTVSMPMTDSEKQLFDQAQANATAEKTRADDLQRQLDEALNKVETAEAQAASEKTRADTAEGKLQTHEEANRKGELRDERIGAFGSAFAEKINALPTVKTRLQEQAADMSDEDWGSRLSEIEELVGVKRDEVKPGEEDAANGNAAGSGVAAAAAGGDLFSAEEVATSHAAGTAAPASPNGGGGQTPERRRSVVAGLMKTTTPSRS